LLKPRYRRWAARRLLVSIEGLINFTVNQMRRFKLMKDLDRLMPIFDLLRAYPDPQDYRPQAGAVEMLHALAGRYELGLITARTPADVLPFLEAVGIADGVFKRIITPEDTINTLPRNDPLALMINSLALQADQVLMVSDTDVNLRAARAMEMATAGILCGMGERGSFVDADLVLTTPLELLDWL
jgi:phosphoglycolate phosphatase-like HAD superfamily hydrolase